MQGKLKTKEKHKYEIALRCYYLALAQQRINIKNSEEKRLMWKEDSSSAK